MELFGFGSDANTTSPSAVFGNDASRSGNSLRDIINRTSKYNLATGRDHLGNPLPAATTNFLQGLDSMESSHGVGSTAKTELKNLLANIPATTGADNQAGTPEGFLYPLYPHQKIALKWMQTMEADENKKGGILADDMGLGKTISTLALILTRPAPLPLGCRYPNPTLIVAPVSLIKQWEREAMTKIKEGRHSLAVLNAHDSSNKNMTYTDFKKFDIVLTTYDKLSREAKAFDEYVKKQAGKNEPVDDDFILKHFSFMGTRSMFHRIVLDEAQAIKSSKSLRFKAVRRLQATYRWVLTGTPMMNSVGELASLISFLRIKPYNDLSHFEHTFGILNPRASGRGGRGDVAMKKMQALLKAIMLRRTKKSKIDGKPIIQLKPKKELTKHVVFGQDEEDYYRSLEKDAQVKMSKFLREGSVGKHYQVALVLLLRLRQACCHPFLHITDLEFVNNDTPIQDMLAYAGNLKADAVQRIVTRITDKELFECPICYEPTENPSILLCGHNTCTDCLTQLRQTAEAANIQAGNEALGAKSTCPECREEIDFSAYVTCDVFKRVHMKEQWDTEQASNTKAEALVDEDGTESGVSDDEETSSDDGGDVDNRGNLIDFIVNDDDDDDDFSIVTKKAKHKRSKGESKKKDEPVQPHELAKLRKVAGRNVVARRRYFNYLERIWLDSAKITMCTELIADIQASGEKILIFSQWTMLLDLIEVQVTSKLKIGYRRYDGAMNSKQRDSAVTDFTNDDDVKLMLVSLKAGNAGLNLTVASHVVIMDPFWNPFIETQAVDRAHRIGQTKEVKVHRILIKDTVEDRIIALQEEKREVVNAALDENAAREVGRLSVNDLAFLFGIGNR
ncbi:SNF2 family N-terminal domain-containing protein [Truncatella angustata]|uniref:SNF2 family N-terminal domain-containing protein n=1 Tax=Truncatella angustata TaxID=152316 RepID=A0A9P8UF57_9PEZI|nr:SNF2 family N-terminal domain-containing protein [Truncatella angustata]KAH6648769.1 SNF2 family N-terminal domain-containing protein [Truncatella angustata]